MITGITQYIYPQKDCAFDFFWNNSQNNWSGSFEILTSNGAILNLNFISGKIFDNQNFIYSFQPQSLVNISGNCSSNYFNLFLNNQFIYSKTGNFDQISGFSLNWTTGYEWDFSGLFPKIFFYGQQPSIDFIYEPSGFYSDPITVMLSGNINNNGPFILNSGEIGRYSSFNNNTQSLYFEISGASAWNSGIKIDKNDTFNFNIIQKQDALPFSDTYIPLILHTNAGILGRNLYIKRYKNIPVQAILLNIEPSISISNINSFLRSLFILDLTITNPDRQTNELLITVSGFESNDILKDGYQDSFTGSWSLILNGQTVPVTNGILSGSIPVDPNIFQQSKRIEIFKQIEQENNNIGFTGSAIYSISGNNFYKTGIIGSYMNIFREYYSYYI